MAAHSAEGHPTSKFPDSPPDSGSEPYSPPNETRTTSESSGFNAAKVSTVTTMATVMPSSHLFMDPPRVSVHHSHPSHANLYLQQQQQPTSLEPQHPVQSQQPAHASAMGLAFAKSPFGFYGPMEPMKLDGDVSHRLVTSSMTLDHHDLQPQYHSGVHNANNQPPKKRKYSDSPPGTLTPGLLMNTLGVGNILPIKPEPCPADLRYGMAPDCSEDDSFGYDNYPAEAGMFLDGLYQVIKWTAHQPTKWVTLYNEHRQELTDLNYRVDADKGFNFSPADDAFVCQKKNHFQITVHQSVSGDPKFIKVPDHPGLIPVSSFYLHFYGIKMESPAQTIKVEQSQSDRSKKLFSPVKLDFYGDQVHKMTIGRLHFSETTSNNMRKKGKPNPDQRYFQLVVALEVHSEEGDVHQVAAHVSERIIVRASNPGQFENDSEVIWNKGKAPESIFHAGRVGINTDSPDEALAVHGNVKVTGRVISPSDVRVKKDLSEIDTREQLKNISQLKVYKYTFNQDYAEYAGMSDDDRIDTGVLAQEVSQVLPDAVRETGDVLLPSGQAIDNFLVVNKDRIFIENVGAVKELCKVTDKLENRITEIELINKKLAKFSKSKCNSVTSSGSSVCPSADSAGVNTLSRSVSNASSNTTAQTPKHCTRNRRHHHHNHSSCHENNARTDGLQQEQTFCNGRIIQIIVIVLVIIMAACLLSITVLYVLDRKHVSQPIAAVDNGYSQKQGSSSSNSASVTMPTVSWPGTAIVPLLPPQCLESPADCPVSCCGTETPPNDPGHPPTVLPSSSSSKKWFKSTRSPNDVNDDVDDPPFKTPAPFSMGWFPLVSYVHPSTTQQLPIYKSTQGNRIDDIFQKPPVDGWNDLKNKISKDANDTPKVRVNRVKRDDGLQSQVALVYIKQLNETLSISYCITTDCVLKRGGNYSYGIPVSRNFPPLFVTLQFVPLVTAPDVTVTLCNEMTNSVCSNDESSYAANQVSAFEWDLPVGFYSQLFFKFRLTVAPQANNVCRLSDSDLGKTFAEYSFFFYRQCS